MLVCKDHNRRVVMLVLAKILKPAHWFLSHLILHYCYRSPPLICALGQVRLLQHELSPGVIYKTHTHCVSRNVMCPLRWRRPALFSQPGVGGVLLQ